MSSDCFIEAAASLSAEFALSLMMSSGHRTLHSAPYSEVEVAFRNGYERMARIVTQLWISGTTK